MKLFVVLLCFVHAFALPRSDQYEFCSNDKCKLPSCHCADEFAPISGKVPQFVVIGFSDSVSKVAKETLVNNFLSKYKNPDKCPVSATWYVPHKYTDYSSVNELRNEGFEIASHSITKTALVDYWKEISKEDLIGEMGGQRMALAQFANMDISEIIGGQIPMLEINDVAFQAEKAASLEYDGTWPTRNLYFPYTLDYESPQQCNSYNCKDTPVPGLWVMPINDWTSQTNISCNSLQGCIPTGTPDEISDWMKRNFLKHYEGNKAPFNLNFNLAWISTPNNKNALEKFMTYLTSNPDVYIVSNRQLLAWMKNPTASFSSCQEIKPVPCEKAVCHFQVGEESVYMVVCGECPKNYPWLHNPLGN